MLKVLIAEDDLMVADIAEEVLVKGGYQVCGIARTVAEGISLGLRHKPDLAVIDMALADGGVGTEIAAQLGALRVGVLYATGNAALIMKNGGEGDAYILKPYSVADLVRALEIVTEIVTTGTGSLPFPRGFQLLLPRATIVRLATSAALKEALADQAAYRTFAAERADRLGLPRATQSI